MKCNTFIQLNSSHKPFTEDDLANFQREGWKYLNCELCDSPERFVSHVVVRPTNEPGLGIVDFPIHSEDARIIAANNSPMAKYFIKR